MTDARGNATNYTYDANTDKLTKVSRTVGGQDVSVDYAYEKDRLTSITRNGVTFHYGYDAYGNQTSVAVGSNVLEQTAYRNKNGLADRMTFATGEAIRNEYDSKEQLIAQYLVKADGTEEKLFTNTYDHYGNVVRHEDHRGDKVTGYQYDFIGRLLGEDASDGFRIRTAYDDKNRVKSYLYRADGKGNKTEFVYGDPAKQQKPGLGYGVLVNGEECIRYTYDAMGNPLSYRGKTMEWEQGRRLKKITGTNLTQTNSYDNDGIRTKKVVNGVTTEFYTSGSAIPAQKSSDGTRLDFLYDDKGNLFAMEYAGERYFYQKNLQGDITGLIDSTGTEVVTYTYDTWGKLLSNAE